MDLDEQLELAHLLLQERKCRVCGQEKNLIDGYYRTRKNVRLASSYSYAVSYTHLTLPTIYSV